nr:C-type lectin domain containing protein [Haemonchus contortus]
MAGMRSAILLALTCGVANGVVTGWTSKFGFSYKVYEQSATFDEAEAMCVADSGHLVSIHSSEENEFVEAITAANKPSIEYYDFVWIGLQQRSGNKTWTWTDGSPVNYLNWAPGEPNDVEEREHCVEFYNNPGIQLPNAVETGWNDIDCNLKMKYFVCKKRDRVNVCKCIMQLNVDLQQIQDA